MKSVQTTVSYHTLKEDLSILTGSNYFTMVVNENFFSKVKIFYVQRTTKYFYSQTTIIELFTDQSELMDLPTGWSVAVVSEQGLLFRHFLRRLQKKSVRTPVSRQ